MRLKIGKNESHKQKVRKKRKYRIRKKIAGTAERPRLCIYKSLKYISAQLIDDDAGKTLCSLSTRQLKQGANRDAAQALGKELASKVKDQKIDNVVFDRNGFLYHGKIKAFADAAREAGLKF